MKKIMLSFSLLMAFGLMAREADGQVSVGISVRIAPPVIPVYTQPMCPVDGWLWVPGYWAWGDEGYYWVPGYWTAPPEVGLLWTPGYWGWSEGVYIWHGGYWGPHVGFYGGVNYGFGYGGVGYAGGGWYGGHFRYNTAVTRVNTSVVHNTYINRTVVNNVNVSRVSYNGGSGGTHARPNAEQESAMRDHHIERTSMQTQHQQVAMHDHSAYASVNHGRPANAAVERPASFNNHGSNVGSRPSGEGSRPMGLRSQPQAHNQQRNVQPHYQARPQPQMHNQQRPQMARPAPHPAGPPRGGGHPQGGRPQGGGHPQGGHPQGGGHGGGGEHHRR